jgi:hypothetical protein
MKPIVRFLFFLFCCCFSSKLLAQPDSVLRIYSEKFQEERMYLHYDKSSYLPGETVWFKAYIIAGVQPSEISKTLYVELTDDAGNMLQRLTAPIAVSSAKGNLVIPTNYKGNSVHVKAYTHWMLNFDSAFLYHKNITVLQAGVALQAKQKPVTTLTFFPEAGYLINGVTSKLAFMANTAYGNPVAVKGSIINNNGKVVDSFTTIHNGMGFVMFKPEAGQTYTAKWKDAFGNNYTTSLPQAKQEGASFSLSEEAGKLHVSIKRSPNVPENLKGLKIVATMFKQLVYRSNAKLYDKLSAEGVIPLEDLPSGILQITLLDANWMPVAERVYFVKNQDYELLADARIYKPNLSAKAKNTLEINVPDTLLGNLSVAITDADANAGNNDNIISSLLLTSDIKGYVHNPNFYFSNDADSTKGFLDLVMLTHGWRRINWQQVNNAQLPKLTFARDSGYLALKGQVLGARPSQIKEAADINLIIKTKDSATRFLFLPLQPDGSFEQPNYIFFDTITVFYQFNKKKDLVNSATVSFGNNLLSGNKKIFIDSGFRTPMALDTNGFTKRKQLLAQQAQLEKLLQGTTLEGVTVKTKAKTAEEKLEEKYVTGMFKGDGYQFDVLNDPIAQGSFSVLNFLQGRVAGLQINGTGNQATASWRGSSTSFFIDEIQADVEQVQTLSMADIAYVKVLRPPFFGAAGGGAGGAVAIYTRKGGDIKSVGGKGLETKQVAGYTIMKEFYSPNYELKPEKKYDVDVRTTLYWNPYVFTDKKNRTIQITFFNNDVSKRLRVDIQGMIADGKLVSIEKTIQ